VVTSPGLVVIGPICGPAEQPCWVCAYLRLSANTDPGRAAEFWRALALGPPASAATSASLIVQRMIGNAAAFEVFRLRTGQLGPEDEGHAVVQDLSTLESTRERLLPHPRCPLPHRDVQPQLPRVLTDDESYGPAGLLVSANLGVLSAWTDESLKQVPLKTGRVRLGPAWSLAEKPREISAFDVDVILDARAKAVRSAMSTYVGRLGPASTTIGVPVESERLGGYSGVARLDPHRERPAVTAVSLHDGSAWLVPAAAVYPFSAANAGLEFEPTSAGAAADWNLETVHERGLCSALAYRAILGAIRSGSPLATLAGSTLAADDETAFLLASLGHLGLRAQVLALPEAAPAFAALAVVNSAVVDSGEPGSPPVWAIGSGLSAGAAVRMGLRDAVGLSVTRHYEGTPADLGDPLLTSFDPRVLADTGGFADWSLSTQASRLADAIAAVEAGGSHALFADTTTIDCRAAGGLVTGTVLLASR
jgi:bacteriocin biosynthesis cyclodehydratase domain-containing protein